MFSVTALRMLSDGSIKRIKTVVDARCPPGLLTERDRTTQREARREALDRERNGNELYEARARLDLKAGGGQRQTDCVVGRLVDLLDDVMLVVTFSMDGDECDVVQMKILQVIDNICVANTYVTTAQDRYVDEVINSHGHGRGDGLARLLQLMLSPKPNVRSMAAKVIANILAGTPSQIDLVLTNDYTCAVTPIGKLIPILNRWLHHKANAKTGSKHHVDVVKFAGMRLDPTQGAVCIHTRFLSCSNRLVVILPLNACAWHRVRRCRRWRRLFERYVMPAGADSITRNS